jgi:DHA3 family macrolide efflux protein-like MFS transporter
LPDMRYQTKFAILWTGQGISMISSTVLQMAIIWYITQKTGSAAVLSAATVAGFLPQAVLGVFIGALVDRYDRKKILILSDLFVAAAAMALFFTGGGQDIPVWLIITVLSVRSVGLAFYRPALESIVPLIIPRGELAAYAGFAQGFKSISMLASPALAALLYPIWGLKNIVLLDAFAALLAVSVFLLVRVEQPPRRADDKKTDILAEVGQGIALVRRDAVMSRVMAVGALYALIYSGVGTLFPHITMNYFGGGVAQSSLVEIVFASGMLLGSLILGVLGKKVRHMPAITISIAAYGSCALLAGLQPPAGLAVFVAAAGIMGIANPFFMGVQLAVFQTRTEQEYLGRILSLNHSLAMLARPVGLAISGSFADVIGVNRWFAVAGAAAIVLSACSLLIWRAPQSPLPDG